MSPALEFPIYWCVRALLGVLQALPLPVVARLGRAAGTLAWILDRRHRHVALSNLTAVFESSMSPNQIRALAKEHFRRLGESYACAAKTAAMSHDQLRPHLDILGADKLLDPGRDDHVCFVAVGHFGNFEVYARANRDVPQMPFSATYRALNQPRLDQLLSRLRSQSGCRYFERRRDFKTLLKAVAKGPLALGFLCDQHAGHSGAKIPFLGLPASTNTAPAVFALRYNRPLLTCICYRTRPAHWRIEFSDPISTVEHGRKRPVEDIMRDVNQAFEIAIKKDPANWFWVHDRWRLQRKSKRKRRPS